MEGPFWSVGFFIGNMKKLVTRPILGRGLLAVVFIRQRCMTDSITYRLLRLVKGPFRRAGSFTQQWRVISLY